MIEIIPAILPKSLHEMQTKLSLIEGSARVVQIDVVDGEFAPNKTWPYTDLDSFQKIVAGDEGMPLWESFDFEFDLMVADALAVVEQYALAGAARIVVHSESRGAIEALQLLKQKHAGEFGVEVGLAIGAHAKVEDVEPFENQFDYIQVMGIERVGFQGQEFEEKVLPLLRTLHTRYKCPLQVDGAVTRERVPELVKAGASRLIVGSAIFGSEDPKQALRELQSKVTR